MRKIFALIFVQTLALSGFGALSEMEKISLDITDSVAVEDYAAARKKADAAIAKNPDGIYLYCVRAGLLQRESKAAMEADLKKAVSLPAADLTSLVAKASAYKGLGDEKSAQKIYDEILSKSPASTADYCARGIALSAKGKAAAALECINGAIARDKDSFNCLLARMGIFLASGDDAGAVADAKRIMELCPDSPFAASTYASIEFKRKNYAASAEVFGKLAQKYPNSQNFARMANVTKSMLQQE